MVGLNSQKNSTVYLISKYIASVRMVASVLSLNRFTITYKPRKCRDDNLERRMKELSAKHRRFGLPRLHFLLKRGGLVVSKHRTARVYKKLQLQIKNRRRIKQMAMTRVPHNKATKPNEIWSFDCLRPIRKQPQSQVLNDCRRLHQENSRTTCSAFDHQRRHDYFF